MGIRAFVRRPSSHVGNVVLRPSNAILALALALGTASASGPPARGARWTWPKNARVRVVVSDDFSAADGSRAAVLDAFRRWQEAGGRRGNGSGVRFDAEPGATTLVYYVVRGTVSDGGQARTFAASGPGGVFVARTTVDRRVTDPVALAHAMAHEIGHTFGLAECDACAAGSSVMTRYGGDYNDVASGRNAPSEDDNAAVRANGAY